MNVWYFVGTGRTIHSVCGWVCTVLDIVRLPPFRQVVIEQWCCAMAKSDCETIHFDVENRLAALRSARRIDIEKYKPPSPSSIDRVEWVHIYKRWWLKDDAHFRARSPLSRPSAVDVRPVLSSAFVLINCPTIRCTHLFEFNAHTKVYRNKSTPAAIAHWASWNPDQRTMDSMRKPTQRIHALMWMWSGKKANFSNFNGVS